MGFTWCLLMNFITELLLTTIIVILSLFLGVILSAWWLLLIPIRLYYVFKDTHATIREDEQECNINIIIQEKDLK